MEDPVCTQYFVTVTPRDELVESAGSQAWHVLASLLQAFFHLQGRQ